MTWNVERRSDPDSTARILRSLPQWFALEDAIVNYVEKVALLDSYLAVGREGSAVGVALFDRHYPESAELALIAVQAQERGGGHGRRLVEAGEADLRADGCQYLEVHTVGPSFDDEAYAATRGFYKALGFAPMHEFDKLDWDGPTLIMVKRL